jgi:lipoprotein NlpI
MFSLCRLLLLLAYVSLLASLPSAARAESADNLIKQARAAVDKGQIKEALALATKAVKLDPKSAQAYLFRAAVYEALAQHSEAVTDCDKTVDLDPRAAAAYNLRGQAQFKLGHFKESVADFDKYLELKPSEKPGHWQRGISCYYAGRFEEGSKQFEGYEEVDKNDVENAVWRYLCQARVIGQDKARAAMLKIGFDRRVPLMEVYALFCGKAKPADVLAAAKAGQPSADELRMRLFYAHLYLGLYYESAGDKKLALEHMTKAAEDYKVGGYMGEVARVHWDVLRKGS